MKNIAIIVASGSGSRANIGKPKQYEQFLGKPLFLHSFEIFQNYHINNIFFEHIIIVANPEYFDFINSTIINNQKFILTKGGETRAESVYNGLNIAQKYMPDNIFIHDAARPYISEEIMAEMFNVLKVSDGVIPVLNISDAVWQIDTDKNITNIINRDDKKRAQTPQAFKFEKIFNAYSNTNFKDAFDDAQIALKNGLKISTIIGSNLSDKLTYKDDFDRMAKLLFNKLGNIFNSENQMLHQIEFVPRIGSGYDAHKFTDGDFITLCGIEIPFNNGLAGHSDADVAWHALVDAILGALALGDIGKAFPPSEAKWKGAASKIFLEYARDMVKMHNSIISNIDLTIICEAPKLTAFKDSMQAKTAEVLQISPSQVGIKATTTEKMGFTGRKEGIAAHAVACILQKLP